MNKICLRCGSAFNRAANVSPATWETRKFCSTSCCVEYKVTPAEERFDPKVMPEPNSGCWLWTGTADKGMYGMFWNGKTMVRAHRFSYEMHFGTVPTGLHVLHRCDTPICVNPNHLFLGTQADNNKDRDTKGRNHAKLCRRHVLEIRQSDASHRVISLQYGISRSTVSKIRSRKIWAHIA